MKKPRYQAIICKRFSLANARHENLNSTRENFIDDMNRRVDEGSCTDDSTADFAIFTNLKRAVGPAGATGLTHDYYTLENDYIVTFETDRAHWTELKEN